MLKSFLNRTYILTLFFVLFSTLFFSCCVILKKTGESAKKPDEQKVELQKGKEEKTSSETAVASDDFTEQDFYESMLVEVCESLKKHGADTEKFPDWLKELPLDEKYFYAVGISNLVTSEQKSRSNALLDAHKRLYEAVLKFLPEGTKPRVNGYEHLSTFTHKNEKAYISAVLVRIPKKRITGE